MGNVPKHHSHYGVKKGRGGLERWAQPLKARLTNKRYKKWRGWLGSQVTGEKH